MTKYVIGYDTPQGFVVLKEVENINVALALRHRYEAKRTEQIVIRKRKQE